MIGNVYVIYILDVAFYALNYHGPYYKNDASRVTHLVCHPHSNRNL